MKKQMAKRKKTRVIQRTKSLIAFAASLSALASVAALSGACVGSDLDFYNEVIQECDYRTAGTRLFADETETSLTPECKETINLLLPFDETWLNAPEGLKDKVTEAFQVILAYPLQLPPENRVLGQMPWVLPAKALCMFAPELYEDCPSEHEKTKNPNIARNVFNYVMSRIDRITYKDPKETGSETASLTPDLLRAHNSGYLLTITDNFWSGGDVAMTPFRRAAIIVHEAWHGDSRSHTLCTEDDVPSGFACDPDMSGPYGVEAMYDLALLHGSGTLKNSKGDYLIAGFDLTFLAYDVCDNIKRLKSLRHIIDDVSCGSVTANWLLDAEGITR